MARFKLPKGYSFEPPTADAQAQGVLVGGQRLYGGADISDAWDASGAHWTFCLATGPDGLFRFRAFRQKQGEASYTEQPLPDSVDGRGNADVQWYDGKAHYSAWMGAQFYQNAVPNFVPFPSIPALQAQIDALKAGVVGGSVTAHSPIPIPPDGAIAALWHGSYTGAEFDTPPEVALRVGKQLAALNELIALLKAAGVLG
jgi:hypothetical protein